MVVGHGGGGCTGGATPLTNKNARSRDDYGRSLCVTYGLICYTCDTLDITVGVMVW